MNVSIIIPVYNARNTVLETLRALEQQTRKDFEIIIVDDGSQDGSPELIGEYTKQSRLAITLIRQANAGPGKARNKGVQLSKCEFIVFLDSDCIPMPNWVEAMVKPLGGNVVGCNCGYLVRNESSLIARYVNYEIALRHVRMVGKYIDTIGTYSASFIKSAFLEAGAFCSDFTTADGEDFDFAHRITRAGYLLKFTGETAVYHFHPDSLCKYLRQQRSRGYWRVKIYLRNRDKAIRGDAYTGLEAQSQFILSHVALVSLPLTFLFPYSPLIGFGMLLLSNMPLGLWTFSRDKKVGLLAPFIASLRTFAGTLGVYTYLFKNFPVLLKEAI